MGNSNIKIDAAEVTANATSAQCEIVMAGLVHKLWESGEDSIPTEPTDKKMERDRVWATIMIKPHHGNVT